MSELCLIMKWKLTAQMGATHRATTLLQQVFLTEEDWSSSWGILLLVSEVECYLLSAPKIRGYRKKSLSLWLQKGMF